MPAHNEKLIYRLADWGLRTAMRRLPPSLKSQNAALRWGYSYNPVPRTVMLRSGMRFNYETADFIPLLLHYIGTFEPHVITLLRDLLKPGDTVLDVGANVGFHTLECWAIVGKSGRVISIEAMPEHAKTIQRNLMANDLPSDDILNVAVGDHRGEVSLGLPEGGNKGMFGINAGPGEYKVPLRRIDDLLHGVGSLALIKMDIEGSELGALQGAKETIRKHRPAIIIELNEIALARCGATSAAVVDFLSAERYGGQTITSNGLTPLSEGHDCDECLFLPDERR